MSIKVINWAYEVEGLKAAQKFTLVTLADHADDDGVCYPSIATLAKKTCQSVSTIKRQLNIFQDESLMISNSRSRRDGGKSSNEYVLTVNQFSRIAPTPPIVQNEPCPPHSSDNDLCHSSDNDLCHSSDNDLCHSSLVNGANLTVIEPSLNRQFNHPHTPKGAGEVKSLELATVPPENKQAPTGKYSDTFNRYWQMYPSSHKRRKRDAWKAYIKLAKWKLEILHQSIELQCENGHEQQYLPELVKFINQTEFADLRDMLAGGGRMIAPDKSENKKSQWSATESVRQDMQERAASPDGMTTHERAWNEMAGDCPW